ncbi:hypothetical protein [Cellulomonas endophytica]|uniref:hypothetical protein n=1 Tax=Cellulomonas endophytica TaxID=2494735 RepID=UPI00101152C7|nr:hypothetical protein [Cellulomonas endophytica]
MSGSQADLLALGVLGLSMAAVGFLVVQRFPALGVVGYLAVVMLVPEWLGLTVGAYLSPLAVVGLGVVAALGRGSGFRPVAFDVVLGLLLGAVVVCVGAGLQTMGNLFLVLLGWVVPYTAARVLGSRTDPGWLRSVLAVVVLVTAVLAVQEWLLGRNLFVEVFNTGTSRYVQWSELRERGGRLRVEGAFGNSIALGGALALVVPYVWSSRLRPALRYVTLLLVLLASVMTISRIGIASTALALVLSLVLLRGDATPAFRRLVTGTLLVGAVVAVPFVQGVFTEAGDEAQGSAEYRGDLLSLLPSMTVIGQSRAAYTTSSGVTGFGDFESIDSAMILIGLQFGWLVLVVLLVAALAAVVGVVRRPNPPLVAVVATLPALTSVAFITQFTAFFWFTVGLAVTEWHRSRPDGEPLTGALPGAATPALPAPRPPVRTLAASVPAGSPSSTTTPGRRRARA